MSMPASPGIWALLHVRVAATIALPVPATASTHNGVTCPA